MVRLSDNESSALVELGKRLKVRRLLDNESKQEVWANKLGVSTPTYRKMEKGNPSVAIGYWIKALCLLNELDELQKLVKIESPHRR